MSLRHGLSAPAAPLILGAVMLLLSGCQAIYDDTKGWASRLEASIVEANRTPSENSDTPEVAGDALAAGASDRPAAAMPPPVPQPPPRKPLAAARPAAPRPTTDNRTTADDTGGGESGTGAPPAGKPAASDTVAGAAGKLVAAPAAATAETASAQTGDGAKAKFPPRPKRKPQIAAKPGDDIAMVLHLSSLRSEQAAKRQWQDLQKTFPEPLGSLDAEIQRTELGDKGTFYRVLAGPLPSRSAAEQACAVVKSKDAKQYCRIMSSRPRS